MTEPHLRAADADRAAVATALGEHMAAGRLTVIEYEERLERAYAARTYGELAELTTDLPSTAAPVAVAPEKSPRTGGWRPGFDASEWREWAGTAVIVLGIWAITSMASGEFLYFWPMWVLGPWGVILLAQAFDDDEDEDDPSAPIGR